jgi:hypothetical protein
MEATLSRRASLGLALLFVSAGCAGEAVPSVELPLPSFLALATLPPSLTARLRATRTESGQVEVDSPLTIDTAAGTANGTFDVPAGTYDVLVTFTITQPFATVEVKGVVVSGSVRSSVDFSKAVPQDLGVDSDLDGLTDLQELTYGLDPVTPACATGCADTTTTVGASKVDAYEASVWSDPGCKGTQYGLTAADYPAGFGPGVASSGTAGTAATVTLYACSVAGVLPSRFITWNQAKRACEDAGKQLCPSALWVQACEGPATCTYPYATSSSCNCGFLCPEACNYGVTTARLTPTGALPTCASGYGAFDMSGNAWEWTATCAGGRCEQRGGSIVLATSEEPSCADTQQSAPTAAGDTTTGFRCCSP